MERSRSRFIRAVMYAVLLHAVTAGVLVLITPDIPLPAKEYFEVSLLRGPRSGAPSRTDDDNPLHKERMMGRETESSSRVALPERNMSLADENVTVPSLDEKLIDASRGRTGEKITQAEYTARERDNARAGSLSATGKRGIREYEGDYRTEAGQPVEGVPGGTAEHPFKLEWMTGGSRKVLSRVLPDYPSGYHHEVRITLRFAVLPNGTVDRVLPVRKGDPLLEELTMDAFRQWRFEPLSPSSEQAVQKGKITFVFQLN